LIKNRFFDILLIIKLTLEKILNSFNCFDDILCEEDFEYLAYQAELEYREWLEIGAWIDKVNAHLREIANAERYIEVDNEYLLTFD
jgi:hypothetical protein